MKNILKFEEDWLKVYSKTLNKLLHINIIQESNLMYRMNIQTHRKKNIVYPVRIHPSGTRFGIPRDRGIIGKPNVGNPIGIMIGNPYKNHTCISTLFLFILMKNN